MSMDVKAGTPLPTPFVDVAPVEPLWGIQAGDGGPLEGLPRR